MALIDTDIGHNQNVDYSSLGEIVRACKTAQAEELAAQCTYQRLVESIKASMPNKSGNNEFKALQGLLFRIEEIAADEMNHAGSLQYCIYKLESCYKKAFEEGFNGK